MRPELAVMDEVERQTAAERHVVTANLKERMELRVPWVDLALLSLTVQIAMQLIQWAVPRFDLVDAVQALDKQILFAIVFVLALCALAAIWGMLDSNSLSG
jgi:hypothetical protein